MPARKSYQMGLLFTHKNGDFGAIPVTEVARQSMAPNLSDKSRSAFDIGAAQLLSVSQFPPPQPFVCVNRSPIRCDFRGGAKAVRERLSEKAHATIPKGIVGGFEFSVLQRNLKELARKAMEMCFRVLEESNKGRFDSYGRQEQCIDHIPYYLSGLSHAHFFQQPI